MNKVFREALKIIKAEGFEVRETSAAGGGSLRVRLGYQTHEREIIVHSSPSSGSAALYLRSRCRWLKKSFTDPTFSKR